MAAINLSPLTAEQESLDRRRKMAEAMQQQAILPIEMPTVPGAKVSPYQGFAKLLQGYIAGKNLERAEEEKKQYETDYMSDIGFLLRNAGQSETIPGDVITPAKEAVMQPPMPIQENVDQVQALTNLTFPDPTNAARAAIGLNLMRPEDKQRIANLPVMSEEKMIEPAVAEVRAPSRQVPLLSPDLLSPENAQRYIKTSAGKTALAQYLLQQQAQQQAAAQKAAEQAQEFRVVAPGGTVLQGNKPVFTAPKESAVREVKTIDANGMPVTKYIPENVLLTMGAIPDQFKGFASDLIMSKYLPPAIMNDPQLLNLVGSQLNKAAGQVTQEDVANYMLRVAETRAKLGYEGIPFNEPAGLTAAPNPLVKPKLPKGVPLGAVSTGKFTPDGRPVYQTPDGKNHVEDK
jgi:hypothetical protein